MSVKILSENNKFIILLYNNELRFQFELLNENVRFTRADFVTQQEDSTYRAGGNSERTYKYKLPHFEGNEENIPMEVINKLKKLGYINKNYPN